MAGRIKQSTIPDNVEYWPECDRCPKLCQNTMNVCLEGEGPDNADLMILGEAPGETEDELNRPFVGQAGEFLRDDLLVPARIPESKVRFSNAVRCHPPKNKTPTVNEIKKCRGYLEAEIRRIRPKVIVAMGNVPLASLLQFYYKGASEEGTAKKSESKVSGISRWQGKMIWLREFDCWMIATYHPSFCMRNERSHSTYSTELVIDDLKKAWSFTKKREKDDVPFRPMPEAEVINSLEGLYSVLKACEFSGEFAFDIETGGVGRTIDKRVIGLSFSNSTGRGSYIPWRIFERSKRAQNKLKEVLTNKDYYKVMHNGAYEVRILTMVYGIPVNNVKYFDTMIAAHLVDENFSKRLKDLAWVYTVFGGYDVELEKYKQEHKIKEDYSKIPEELLAPYAALDSVATWILYKKLKPLMEKEGAAPLFNKIVMPVRRVMSDAEINGMRCDTERAREVYDLCDQAKLKLEKEIYKCAGHEFNINSPKQLQDILYDDMGFTPLKETKGGYSADAESVEYIATQPNSEIATFLSDRAYVKTMMSTHIGQALEFTWPEDGRVHTNYNLTGAVTGRTSASRPSLQNVPQDALVRSLYVASPGNLLVEADLKSAEMATIAAISGEETFIRSFNEGLDIHSETYRALYDLPPDYECSKLERRQAKTINFGLVYGLTPIGLAQRLGITVEEATAFINLYFKKLPNVAHWMESQKLLVKRKGYVVSVFGRKRRIPNGLSDKWGDIGRAERQAMNSPIQSSAADYTYIGLVRLRKAVIKKALEGKIVHTVHDCVVTDTPKPEVDGMVGLIKEAFETPVKVMPIRMKVDVEINKRWGEENESRLREVFNKFNLKISA